MSRALLGALLAALALAVGCGDDDGTVGSVSPSTTQAEQSTVDAEQTETSKPKPDKPSGVEIVATCADQFGQDIYAKPPGKPAFMDCLERLNAPQDVIDAWK